MCIRDSANTVCFQNPTNTNLVTGTVKPFPTRVTVSGNPAEVTYAGDNEKALAIVIQVDFQKNSKSSLNLNSVTVNRSAGEGQQATLIENYMMTENTFDKDQASSAIFVVCLAEPTKINDLAIEYETLGPQAPELTSFTVQ